MMLFSYCHPTAIVLTADVILFSLTPHFNAMMMSSEKFFAPLLTSALMKQPNPSHTSRLILGTLAFEMLYSYSLLLYTALSTFFTRSYQHIPDLLHEDTAVSVWSQGHQQSPQDKGSYSQKAWDTPRVEAVSAALLDQASDATTRARLLAVSRKESNCLLWCQNIHLFAQSYANSSISKC